MTMNSVLVRALRDGNYRAARVVSTHWHGGRDHNITGLSHGREWKSTGLIKEIEGNLDQRRRMTQNEEVLGNVLELEAFLDWAKQTWISSVDTAHGHHFVGGDDDEVSCLACGGNWEQVHNDTSSVHHGRYQTSNGDDPTECPDMSVPHGEADCRCTGGCPACAFICNCITCRG